MIYSLAADFVVMVHFSFILFALFGGLLGLWRRWCLLIHLPTAIWITLLEIQGWICPLTPLENRLRLAANQIGYSDGFIEHYLIPVIYPAGLTPLLQLILGLAAATLNLVIYLFVFRRLRRH